MLQCAESLDSEGMKKAVRMSMFMFIRGGADDEPSPQGKRSTLLFILWILLFLVSFIMW